jgi:hypothetical protein
MDAPGLVPAIEPLAFLLGDWVGEGEGEYPTIESFGYVEQISFSHVGKPFLVYTQRTRHADDGRPLHAEMGYLRPVGADGIELSLAHPTGITEVSAGSLIGQRIDLATTAVGRTPTAKEVTAVERTIEVDGDRLTYTVRMAAVGQPLQHHLSASLRRH